MHNLTTLYDELNRTLLDIDTQIKHIKNDLKNDYPEEQREKINVWFWTRYPDGKYVLADLLVARADCLSAMARIRVSIAESRKR